MAKFQNKYRIESARDARWDYAWNGYYFITICTSKRACIFGHIENHEMVFSPVGEIVHSEWNRSFDIRTELTCEIVCIMPNHIHAILQINSSIPFTDARPNRSLHSGVAIRTPKSISSFVAGFKSSATKMINAFRQSPGQEVWQARFHDHIIRDEQSFCSIYQYIKDNPANWRSDAFFKDVPPPEE